MADKIRIGVIGVGMIGGSHLRAYADIPEAEVVALCDIDEAALARRSAEFGVERTFTAFRDLLACDDIDAVDVCLHNNKHAPVTITAFEAGKDVYCEKPMAGSWYDARAMYDAARQTGRKLHIQLGTLYSPEHRAAKRMIEAGLLGKLYYARSLGHRRRGRVWVDGYGTPPFVSREEAAGGALYDMGIYHLAQVMDLLGNPEVQTVSGATYQEIAMYEDRKASAGFDVEELGLGFVRLAGGITLDIEEAWAIHYDGSESSKVLGSQGGLKLAPLTYYTTQGDVETSASVDTNAANYRWGQCEDDYRLFGSSQGHWIAALQGRCELLPTAELALNVAFISEGIYRSQELGREVGRDEIEALSKSLSLPV